MAGDARSSVFEDPCFSRSIASGVHSEIIMWSRVQKNRSLLKLLSKAVIKAADKDLVDAVDLSALNVLKGDIRLTPLQKQRLVKHKRALRALAQKIRSLQKVF